MLQCPYAYVASVCCKCFIYFGRMLQQMLYVASVTSAGAARGRRKRWSIKRSGPRVGTRTEAGVIASGEHKAVSMGMAVGVEHEAASMLDYSLSPYSRLMRLVSTPSRASSSM